MKKVGFDLRRLGKFRDQMSGKGLQNVFKGWGSKYLTWIKRRYLKNAAGGGEWPPLRGISYQRALGTPLLTTRTGKKKGAGAQARMKTRYKEAAAATKILIDTGTLFGALSVGGKGNLFELLKKGVRVGFTRTPEHKGSRVTIRAIAIRHQKGDRRTNLPQRKILHVPDQALRQRMLIDLERGIIKIGRML